jgi:uncharacterized protein (TIGR02145 family)
MTDKSTLLISAPDEGEAIISVYDITGKVVTQIDSYLENYTQEFTISGLRNGMHLINVKGDTYQFSGKLISNGKSNGTTSIEKISGNLAVDKNVSRMDAKGVQATIDMEYTTGDRLKFTGISGIYSTVRTDIPSDNKTITFNFIPCTDGDGNNYPVVDIGGQILMAENLKTTKYRDGNEIQNVTDGTAWTGLTTGAYCWYNNDAATNKNIYGALYNWYGVDDSRKLCPTGWHVPSAEEWLTLAVYLGGADVAGGKLKETGTTHWTSPNESATNESGFTALPGGYRSYSNGSFYNLGNRSYWWSSTSYFHPIFYTNNALIRYIFYNLSNFIPYNERQEFGYSVRCLKDK